MTTQHAGQAGSLEQVLIRFPAQIVAVKNWHAPLPHGQEYVYLCEKADAKIASLSAENATLREQLGKYGQHTALCAARHPAGDHPCNCGFDAALAPDRKGP